MKAIIIVFLLLGHILQYSQSVAEQSVRIVLLSQDCPARQRCFTLPECLRNTSSCFTSSTTVTFLPGEHYTDGISQFVTVQGVTNLTIIGSVQGNASTIYCNEKVGIAFVQCQDLTIYGISFYQCGRPIPTNLLHEALQQQTQTYYYFFEGTKAALFLVNVMNLNATKVQISHSDGYGLFALNVLGYSTIKDSVFSYNNQYALLYHERNPMYCEAPVIQNTTSCTGGNAVFLYQDTPHCPRYNFLPQYALLVVDSIFTHGVNLDYQHSDTGWDAPPYYLYTAGGLSIFTGQRSYKIGLLVHNATIDSNIGHNGANVVVYIHDLGDTSTVIINSSTITNGNRDLEFFANTAYSGGINLYYGASASWKDACEDLWAPLCTKTYDFYSCTKTYNLNYFSISNCTFANNSAFLGAAMCFVSIIDALPLRCVQAKAIVEQCYVHNNTGVSSIVYAEEDVIGDSRDRSLFLELQNSAFHQNQLTKDTNLGYK